MENIVTNQIQEQLKPAKLKSFGQLLKQTLGFMRDNRHQLFSFYFFPVVIIFAINALTQEVAKVSLATHSVYFGVLSVILVIISLLVIMFGNIIIYGSGGFVDRLQNKESINLKTEYKRLIRLTPSFIFLGILFYCLGIGGFVLFLVPGILLLTLSSFCFVILPVEEQRGIGALTRSFELVSGRKLSVFLKIVGLVLVSIAFLLCLVVLSFLVALLIATFTHLSVFEVLSYINSHNGGLVGGSMFDSFFKVWFMLINVVISIAFYSFYTSFIYFLYRDAKETFVLKDEVYKTKTRKLIKGFAWLGFVCIVIIFVAVPVISFIHAKNKAVGVPSGSTENVSQQTVEE